MMGILILLLVEWRQGIVGKQFFSLSTTPVGGHTTCVADFSNTRQNSSKNEFASATEMESNALTSTEILTELNCHCVMNFFSFHGLPMQNIKK